MRKNFQNIPSAWLPFSLFKNGLILLFSSISIISFSQNKNPYKYSTEADLNHEPCWDTIKILGTKRIENIDLMLPSWRPVIHNDSVHILEGKVRGFTDDKHTESQAGVSYEDLPLYHYTHDFCFNVIPDSNSRDLLVWRIYDKKGKKDTVLLDYIHTEWESGLAADNDGNPAAKFNRKGDSFGFYSAGHTRNKPIIHWPVPDDWVHVEGLWIWDRGHPPARTEIHPARFVAVKRHLFEYIKIEPEMPEKLAQRVDIFASGDGGAFYNNRTSVPSFVNKVKMNSKDYKFTFDFDIPKPYPTAKLKMKFVLGDGNTYTATPLITMSGEKSITFYLPWKTGNFDNHLIFSASIYVYWDRDISKELESEIQDYKVTLLNLNRIKSGDPTSNHELRFFFEAGGTYFFLNEFADENADILRAGMGKSMKHHWEFKDVSITISLRKDQKFRIYCAGWEADGMNRLFGDLVDCNSPCNPEIKKKINERFFSVQKVGLRGCLDDDTGEISEFFSQADIGDFTEVILLSKGGPKEEFCPFADYDTNKFFNIKVRIERIKPKEGN